MNSQLKDDIYEIPEEILRKMYETYQMVTDENACGMKRAKKLLIDKKVNYNQLKRIIHDIKYLDKEKQPIRYSLYGGELMEKWALNFLNQQRKRVKDQKHSRLQADDIGQIDRKNAYNQTHKKKNNYNTNTDYIKSNSDSSVISSIGIMEEVDRIKTLIKY